MASHSWLAGSARKMHNNWDTRRRLSVPRARANVIRLFDDVARCVCDSVCLFVTTTTTTTRQQTFGPRERDPLSEWPSILIGRLVTCLAGQARPWEHYHFVWFILSIRFVATLNWSLFILVRRFGLQWNQTNQCQGDHLEARMLCFQTQIYWIICPIIAITTLTTNTRIHEYLILLFPCSRQHNLNSWAEEEEGKQNWFLLARFDSRACRAHCLQWWKQSCLCSLQTIDFTITNTHTQNRQRNIKTNKITIGKGTHRN